MSLSVTNAIRSSRSFFTVQPSGKNRVVPNAIAITFIRSSLCSGCRWVVVMTHLNLEEFLQAVLPARLQAAHLVGNW